MNDKLIRRLTAAVVLGVAAIAGAISFNHISDLARAHGQSEFASPLLPISVDAAIVASSLVMVSAARQRLRTPPLARVMLILSVGATIAANLAYGLPYGAVGGIISCWPAVSFIGCAELALIMVRNARRADEPQETYEVESALIHKTFSKEIAAGVTPTVREIKAALQVGQPKALWVREFVAQLNEAAYQRHLASLAANSASRRDPERAQCLAPRGSIRGRSSRSARPHQDADRHQVRWRDAEGVQRKKLFPGQQKRAAEAFFAATKTALDRGVYVDQSSKLTMTDYARRWIEIQPYRPSSVERRQSQLRTHIEPHRLGRMRLVAVKPSDVQAFATEKDRTMASESVRSLMRFLAAVFASAARDRLIAVSPCSRIMLTPAENHPVVPLTPAQVAQLSECVPERMRAMVVAQAGLGLRVGELLALRLADVDFLRREVRVTEQIHPRTRERMLLKTPAARRTVPMPEVVSLALAAHLAAFPANAEGYIFQNAEGLPYQAHTYQQMLSYRAKRAGLPHTTTHDLRHTYATWLLGAGESVVTVAARLGHRNANMVIQTYGHLVPGTEDRTRRAIDLAWKGALDVPSAAEVAR